MAHEDKAKHYIDLLNVARANGSWNELPELVRKVKKHAPNNVLLAQTATAEHYVATHAARRPQTAQQSTSDASLKDLQQTLSKTGTSLNDEDFQAQTCIAWAAYTGAVQGSPDTSRMADTEQLFDRHGKKSASPWTKICLLKAVCMQERSYSQEVRQPQLIPLYRAAISWIELNSQEVKSSPQMSYWAEQILGDYGTSAGIRADGRLHALQLWSRLTSRTQEVSPATYGNTSAGHSRAAVWELYYIITSQALEHSASSDGPIRAKLASELRVIESAYETSLLKNRKFPKASDTNTVVEDWVERVIKNWQVLCGPSWKESDLGQGGRNGATRNVLDILYRAATKTFHSTLILRRLFQVHKALAEFDLAYQCLDTYIELVNRGRERATKAGEPSPESEDTMLSTVAEGVEGLCSYGRQAEARRAFDLVVQLEDWLDEIIPEDEENQIPNGHGEIVHIARPPSERVLEIVHRAIGIGKAQWAFWTPFNETRSELQAEALQELQKASIVANPDLSTIYALAVLHAEMRDIPSATRWTKAGLQKLSSNGTSPESPIHCAFWHLMTLLLSSQQDFDTALQSSGAALDLVLGSGFLGLSNNSTEKQVSSSSVQVAADLECDDLQKISELQITYLSLIELLDGPEAALNRSNELLGLYSKIYTGFGVDEIKAQSLNTLAPPKTSAGTLKSVKGSIFSRRKATSSIAPSATTTSLRSTTAKTANTERPGTQSSVAPTIQVTDETGNTPEKHHRHHLPHLHMHHSDHGHKRYSKDPRPATARRITEEQPEALDDNSFSLTNGQLEDNTTNLASPTSREHDNHHEAKQDIGDIPHNLGLHHDAPPPIGHNEQPPEQDVRLPNVNAQTTSTSPLPRFSQSAAQKHALVVLHKLWLTVSTLYRRSHMFEDSKEACDEAAKAASGIEAIVATADPSARALADPGWGGGDKSSDEVWADVHCAKGELLHTIAQRRNDEGTLTTNETWREIVEQYEHCLMYSPNHPAGIVGLSNILLDYYDKKIDLSKKVDDGQSLTTRPISSSADQDIIIGAQTPSQEHLSDPLNHTTDTPEVLRKTPENLNRIAARDRAYGLLNTLSKLGSGWDNSEVWFALARAHELGGEIEKAKNILWWCIELEDTKPIRHWRNLGCGGYVL